MDQLLLLLLLLLQAEAALSSGCISGSVGDADLSTISITSLQEVLRDDHPYTPHYTSTTGKYDNNYTAP